MSYEPSDTEREDHRPAAEEVLRLLAIMARLRGPGGCPWDREQTLDSLRPYLLEETYEVLEAIDTGDDHAHLEELGDLLLQVVFQAELKREAGAWTMAEVARGIADKLHFRHPHVFGDVEAADADAAYKSWEKVKAAEKKKSGRPRKSILDGVPKAAPSLLRAERVGEKAAHAGFDWPDLAGVRAKVDEEIAELDEALASGDAARVQAELGDVLLTLASLGRHAGVHAEDALRESVERFIGRYQRLEAELSAEGLTAADLEPDVLEARWQSAKGD
jgi:tetrapyrrole methylase family protein / MazG family protein